MTYQPHEQRVIDEKAELDEKIAKLKKFTTPVWGEDSVFHELPVEDRSLLRAQLAAMSGYSSILGRRISRFQPAPTASTHGLVNGLANGLAGAPMDLTFVADRAALLDGAGRVLYSTHDDFPPGKAFGLSGEGACDGCR